MGASVSTLGGWALLSVLFGYYIYRSLGERWAREAARAAAQRQRLEERQNMQSRKELKDKAKRQRGEAYSKDVDESTKVAQPKPRAPKTTPNPTHAPDLSSDDGVDNKEFARQLASVKQGTNLSGPKKDEQKRQKSVKQSRARTIEEPVEDHQASAPSSTAGADADDDESPMASPEVTAADAGGVADMLEPKASGPSVLRLTGTDKVKQKEKKSKTPEKVETKKQRQNRQKAEAAKVAREEAEKQSLANGDYVPVQPLDTFDTSSHTDVSVSKAVPPATSNTESWMSSLPSEEEQMEILRGQEEAWSTVTTKKTSKGKKKEPATDNSASESGPIAQPAAVAGKAQKASINGNGKPAKPFTQQSAFAALSTNEEPDVENEWDV